MTDYIHEHLKWIASIGLGEVWTERHWQQANGVLVNYQEEQEERLRKFWRHECPKLPGHGRGWIQKGLACEFCNQSEERV